MLTIGPPQGDEIIIATLDAFDLSILSDELRAVLKAIGADAGDYSKAPELPNQRYIRSGDLGQGWESEPQLTVSGDSLMGVLTNAVPYAGDVQGDDQHAIFQGRWRTTEQILTEWEDEIAARAERALDQAIPQ